MPPGANVTPNNAPSLTPSAPRPLGEPDNSESAPPAGQDADENIAIGVEAGSVARGVLGGLIQPTEGDCIACVGQPFELAHLWHRHRPALQTQRVHGGVGELGRSSRARSQRDSALLQRGDEPVRSHPARTSATARRRRRCRGARRCHRPMQRMRRARPPRARSHGRCRAAALRRRVRHGIHRPARAACN